MTRTVHCSKFLVEKPGLEKPPFKGPVGQLIFERVSEEAWRAWRDDMQIKVLNEYRLNMGDPNDYGVLIKQMYLFLGLEEGQVASVGDEVRGRS
jgi:Fe-S cluster biosynthesis and repair protein YggX